MIARVIETSLAHRGWVLAFALLLTVTSLLSVRQLPIDAIPDLSDVQVVIRTPFAGQAPQIVEDQVTYPITTRMLAVPRIKAVRGFSMFGDSFVYVLFEDGTDPYWARTRVLEYLSQARADLPDGIEPQLGPDATGVGWVYQYALIDRSGRNDLADLRSLQDWHLRFELQRVPGVAEVASVGGFVRQYEVVIDPRRLQAYGIGFGQLVKAIRSASHETSGARLEMAETEYVVRGVGYIRSLEELGAVSTGVLRDGQPILLRDVAELRFGPAPRSGIAELNGEGEAVGGIIVMRHGENAMTVIDAVKARIEALRPHLPPGVELVTVYDRSTLIERAIDNLRAILIKELLLVSLVCALFLWHARSALVVAISLPLGVLIALAIMSWQGLTANIMSVGGIAIAIGAMVDAAVVMIENAHKHLEDWARRHGGKPAAGAEHWRVIGASATEVGPALFFALLITALSFLPVFMLQAQEGRMFAPLAWTKTWAMAVAAGLAITLVPVLMGYWIRGRFADESRHRVIRWVATGYRPLLAFALHRPWIIVLLSVLGMASAAWPLARLGSEFMPELEEGDVVYMPSTLPGLSPSQAQAVLQRTNRLIMSVPEVASVFGKAGRAETATDPAPLTMLESTVQFIPESEWRPGLTREALMAELQEKLRLPGLTSAWVPPILNRINMQVSGIRTPLGVQVTGPDLLAIDVGAERIAELLAGVPGTRSAFTERAAAAPQIDIVPDREQLARHGLSMEEVQNWLAAAIGGEALGRAVEGRERYPIVLRVAQEWRDSPEAIAALPVVTPAGTQVPLGALAEIRLSEGPAMIRSEDARLATFVFINLVDADLGGYIARAEQQLRAVSLPAGVSWRWVGSYEHLQRAAERLQLAVPLTLLIVFVLLYAIFRRTAEAFLIMLTVPFALIGGLWLLWILGYAFSVAVAVGLIALAGVAAQFGVVMLIYLDVAVQSARAAGRLGTEAELDAALVEGALRRLRPKLMTVITLLAGLLPILLATGAGSATMQRIAAPMIGGMISAPLLSMIVLPAIYKLWLRRHLLAVPGARP